MPRKRSRRLDKKRTKKVLIKRTKIVRKSKSKSNVGRKTRNKRQKGGSLVPGRALPETVGGFTNLVELESVEAKFKEMKEKNTAQTDPPYAHLTDILSNFYPHFLSELRNKVLQATLYDVNLERLLKMIKSLDFDPNDVNNYTKLINFLNDKLDIQNIIQQLIQELIDKYQKIIDFVEARKSRLKKSSDQVDFEPIRVFDWRMWQIPSIKNEVFKSNYIS